MKCKTLTIIICLLVLVGGSNLAFSLENTPSSTVLSYFTACKNGDISTMESLITGRFYQRRKVLMEQNKEYPQFLQSRYAKTEFQVVSSEIEESTGYAKVVLEQIIPSGDHTETTLVLQQDGEGAWKIRDEVLPE